MRTKFNLLATLLMVVLCVGFTSCSDDEKDEIQDDKTLDLLIGSWNTNFQVLQMKRVMLFHVKWKL